MNYNPFFCLVYYYNYELEDYNVASSRNMIDMVKVFHFAIQEGKVMPVDTVYFIVNNIEELQFYR